MKDKRFPTILGIILLIIILIAGVYLSTQTTTFSSKASTTCQPTNPQITNLTYASFDFSFTTPSSCVATLVINNKIYQDSSSVSNTHYFKIGNLSPSTPYQFHIISSDTTYSWPEFSLTTTVQPNSPIPASNLAWGRIIDSSGNPVSGAIIYLTLPGSQALSAFSNKDGNWNISFATSFNDDKTDWFFPDSVVDEDLIVYAPDASLTQITNRSDNNDPVPDIIIGQNYFTDLTSGSSDGVLLGSGPAANSVITLSLTSPKESETITTLRPDIFGQGPINSTFQLTLDTNTVNVTVPSNGTWHWSPSQDLSPGLHKLTLIYQSTNISRNFTVATDSNYLAFSSTPSATLVPTLMPTQSIVPTLLPTTKPTLVPTVRTAKISTTSALYESGGTFPTYFLIILSTLLFGVSFYYSRK